MIWISEDQLKGLRLSFGVKKKIIRTRSKFQTIEIIETITHGKLLLLDKKVMLTERDEFIYHEMIAHVPLFSHLNPNNILIIGGGDGGTARECLKHTINSIDVCEIDKKVVDLSLKYLPFTGNAFKHKKVRKIFEDGFEFLKKIQNNDRKYDVIILDSSDPIGPASILFKKSFLLLAQKCLSPDGIICMQCESPFFLPKTIKNTTTSLRIIFKNVQHYVATIPTYPFGLWTFILASNAEISPRFDKKLRFKTKYYNPEIHKASFALPNLLKKLI